MTRLRSDLYTSDLYYRDPALFGRQTTVDRYIDHIAAAFAVSRSSLHVVKYPLQIINQHDPIDNLRLPASKGLLLELPLYIDVMDRKLISRPFRAECSYRILKKSYQ